MQQVVGSLHNVVKAIAEPNTKVYPDASARQALWKRNITNIYVGPLFLCLYAIFSSLFNFPKSMHMIFLSVNLTILTSFMLLCRSYMKIFNAFYVSLSFIFELFLLDMVEEAAYFYIGHAYVVFVSIMIRTGKTGLAFFAGIVQAVTFLTKFKRKFVILIENEDSEIFADKFIKITLFYFISMLLVNITIVSALNKRTAELFDAKSSLEKALDQQKTFILSFSHELRNPINSLLGNLQLVLQGEVLSIKAAEMIGIAKVCGEILLHSINNVLDTGKNEIEKLEVNSVPTHLYELFQRTWGIYSELLRQKKIQGQIRIENDVPAVVKIDSHKVNQILLNLIGNSIKFTEKGSIIVTVKWLSQRKINEKCFYPVPYDDVDEGVFEKEENISTVSTSKFPESTPRFRALSHCKKYFELDDVVYPQEEVKGVLKIIVKDTGSGMKKEALERLFQKFSQVSENISQRNIGTGLGLFITKEICQAMNGEIRAYSKLDVGTTFVVCLPTITAPLNRIERADSEEIMEKLLKKNLKALVADDSPFNVNLTCNYISKFGGSVVAVAHNGYDAFLKFKECRAAGKDLDVVTLDIDMPIMDGRTVCDRIREYERQWKLKPVLVILISGNYDKEQVDEYLDRGRGHRADCFLRKPVLFSEFNRAVYSLLQERS